MSSPPSSTLAIVFSTGILGLVTGFFLGQGSSLGLFSSSNPKAKKKSWPNSYDVAVHPDSSDEELMEHLLGRGGAKESVVAAGDGDDSSSAEEGEEDEEGGENGGSLVQKDVAGLSAFEDNYDEEFKLVLVVRTDIGMQKGT